MNDTSFVEFYRALWGRDPFPWQERLAQTVAQHGWPPALDIPTGCGKTSTIDIALWHLATASPGTAPRRIVYVVDRRLVVDGTARHADAIASALEAAPAGSVLGRVADRLRDLARDTDPLRVLTLRGGVPRDHSWVANPLQPLIVLSTVDQVGSRLLFRGYGVSPSMLPVHAALLANDSVLLLDEAHLSEPFRQTVTSLTPYLSPTGQLHSVPPLRTVLLSATLPTDVRAPFALTDADRSYGPLARRLGVGKRTYLVTSPDQDDQFTARMVQQVQRQLSAGAKTVLAVVNRVTRARQLFNALRTAPSSMAEEVELLIGPSRAVVRDARTLAWIGRVAASRNRAAESGDAPPFVLVATQCVEAGVDFDVDALVTESAPLDALRQRFGRLDRLGHAPNAGQTRAAVVHRQRRTADPIYGDRIDATWAWLTTIADAADANARELGVVDFGVDALQGRLAALEPAMLDAMMSERPDAPLLLPHHMEAWADTSAPSLVPAPSLFLHGPRGTSPVRIGWRADLERLLDGVLHPVSAEEATRALSLLPPAPGELIELQLTTVRRWLDRVPRAVEDVESDLPVSTTDEPARAATRTDSAPSRVLFRQKVDGSWEPVTIERIRAGDLLMAPASLGGCDGFGWAPDSSSFVTDVAEDAHEQLRGEWIHRLHQQLDADGFRLVRAELDRGATENEVLARLRDASHVPARLADRITWSWYDQDHPERGLVLRAPLPGAVLATDEDATEGDDGSFGQHPITLDVHLEDVERWVERFLGGISLGDLEQRALRLAARWHDVGKSDPGFQAMLRGEVTASRFDTRPLLAKSTRAGGGARRVQPLPRGWRHEVLSVVMAADVMAAEPVEVRELALWLIATHHGRGRLTFDDVPASLSPAGRVTVHGTALERPGGVSATSIIAAHIDRGEQLAQRYGPYALAWLETLLRMADHRASARPRTSGGTA